jgi:hypothetical protein
MSLNRIIRLTCTGFIGLIILRILGWTIYGWYQFDQVSKGALERYDMSQLSAFCGILVPIALTVGAVIVLCSHETFKADDDLAKKIKMSLGFIEADF